MNSNFVQYTPQILNKNKLCTLLFCKRRRNSAQKISILEVAGKVFSLLKLKMAQLVNLKIKDITQKRFFPTFSVWLIEII